MKLPRRDRCRIRSVACALLLLRLTVPAELDAGLVINELLVDPEGADAGREFVEILNAGVVDVSLTDLRFEFANGAEAPHWTLRWEGAAGEVLAPGERYLITDRNWMGEAQPRAQVYLGLQNGPDAVRLSRSGEAIDLVGYGALTDTSLFEGEPVSLATGRALARRPDGADTDRNAVDLVQTDPTPGAPNFLPWAIEIPAWSADPPSLGGAGSSVRLRLEIANQGLNPLPPMRIDLLLGPETFPGRLDGIEPGASSEAYWELTPTGEGELAIGLQVLPPAVPDTLRVDCGALQVGTAALRLNEVLAAPTQEQEEWIELAAGDESVALGAYRLRDEDGDWRSLPAFELAAGELVVFAQDSSALAAWHDANRQRGAAAPCGDLVAFARIRQWPHGWPSLNNSSAQDRDFADRVYLANERGTVVDHLTWEGPAEAVPAPEPGTSLERIAAAPARPGRAVWAPSTALAGSTPGCPNSVATPPGAVEGFRVEPRVLDRARGATTLFVHCELLDPANGLRLEIYDLWGARVRDLGADRLGAGPRTYPWDGRDDQARLVPPGAYVISLQVLAEDGAVLRSERRLAAVQHPAAR